MRVKKSVALLLVLFFLTASCLIAVKPAFSFSVAAAEDTWTLKAPMQVARYGLGVAVVDGKIYAIGGTGTGRNLCTNINEEYTPETDTWSNKTAMPTERAHFGIAVYQNKIYCIGGLTSPNADPTGINEVYDPVTDTWETKTPMPTQQEYLDANLVKGKIYLIGCSPNVNEVYDPSTDTWTTKTAPPVAVKGYVSAVVDDKIYVIGGWDSDGAGSNLNQIYTPETDTWRSGSPIPIGYPGGAGATTGVLAPKRIYVFGGGFLFQNDKNQIYDPENDSWSAGATMPTARTALGVAVVDDLLYVIGGGNGWTIFLSRANEKYTPFGYGTVPPVISVILPENQDYNVSSVSLAFAVNKPAVWMGYSLDGNENVTVTGNLTLTGLSNGLHNVTIYARDELENTGASETISFSVEVPEVPEPFPVVPVAAASVATIAVVGVGLLVYFKKRKH